MKSVIVIYSVQETVQEVQGIVDLNILKFQIKFHLKNILGTQYKFLCHFLNLCYLWSKFLFQSCFNSLKRKLEKSKRRLLTYFLVAEQTNFKLLTIMTPKVTEEHHFFFVFKIKFLCNLAFFHPGSYALVFSECSQHYYYY